MRKLKINSTSFSKTLSDFMAVRNRILKEAEQNLGVFTKNDVLHLPGPVKNYFDYCGYIGAPKMHAMKAVCKDVRFLFGKGKPITIDYMQYNIVRVPARIAYIDSRVLGISFEGLDLYTGGSGSMKGILANHLRLFNESGEALDQSGLVTFLSECLLFPNAALQDYIAWEEMDALHARATISYYGNRVSGIFTFNEIGEMISFDTDDRKAVTIHGTRKNIKWSAVFSDYMVKDGIHQPGRFQAIWHYDDGDLLYFDGKDVSIEFNPTD
jgi:hypothetical protein